MIQLMYEQVNRELELGSEILLYSALVRLILEYSVQFCCPQFRKHVDKPERVYRRAMRMIKESEAMPQSDRLEEFYLVSSTRRRLRDELITVFKYRYGEEKFHKGLFKLTGKGMTRANVLKMTLDKFRLETR